MNLNWGVFILIFTEKNVFKNQIISFLETNNYVFFNSTKICRWKSQGRNLDLSIYICQIFFSGRKTHIHIHAPPFFCWKKVNVRSIICFHKSCIQETHKTIQPIAPRHHQWNIKSRRSKISQESSLRRTFYVLFIGTRLKSYLYLDDNFQLNFNHLLVKNYIASV